MIRSHVEIHPSVVIRMPCSGSHKEDVSILSHGSIMTSRHIKYGEKCKHGRGMGVHVYAIHDVMVKIHLVFHVIISYSTKTIYFDA